MYQAVIQNRANPRNWLRVFLNASTETEAMDEAELLATMRTLNERSAFTVAEIIELRLDGVINRLPVGETV